jgi:hypothetical protein
MVSPKYRGVISLGLLLFTSSLSGFAHSTESVVFHCPTACKVYVDGKLLVSLPNGGVKQSSLINGQTTTVLISRPGKHDWVRSITPIRPLSINPEESGPTVIPDDVAEAPTSRPPDESSNNRASAPDRTPTHETNQEPQVSWLDGVFATSRSAGRKRMQIKNGSHTCDVDVDMDLILSGGTGGDGKAWYSIEYDQDMDMYELVASGHPSEWCEDHAQDPEFMQHWKFEIPISLTKVAEDSFTFSGDMHVCQVNAEKCKLPPGTSQITGQLRRNGSGVALEFGDPLNATFELERYKSK